MALEREGPPLRPPVDLPTITADWLTAVLRGAGVLPAGRVSAFSVQPLAADRGLTGQVVRLRLSFVGAEGGPPSSIVMKCAAAGGRTRELADRFDLYEREAQFYRRLAAGCPVPTPRCYYASGPGEPSVLLLEDLGGGHEIDLVQGCSLSQASTIVDLLAELHACYWQDAERLSEPWLPAPNHPVILSLIEESSAASWALFRRRFGLHMPAPLLRLGARLVRDRSVLDRLASPPWTLVHGDMRAHNVVFQGADRTRPRAIIDWQTATRGRGPIDVAGLFASSLSVADRRIAERELLPAYHQGLTSRGVRGYDYDRCFRDYRLAVANQFGQVIALYALANVNDKIGEDVAASTGERLVAALLDLNVVDLLRPSSLLDAGATAARRALPARSRALLRRLRR